MTEKEIWKDVVGYEGLYKISSLGRLKSLLFKTQKLLNPSISTGGYARISLWKNKKPSKNKLIHQLVAMAFLDHIPNGFGRVVDHINNNHADNRVENLQIVDMRENLSKDKFGCTSRFAGVFKQKGRNRWRSTIRIGDKAINLGSFKIEEEAAKAYQKALKELLCCSL